MKGLSSGPRQTTARSAPPGAVARRRFANAATGSAKNMTPKRDVRRSNASGSNGCVPASAHTKRGAGVSPAARSRATSIMGAERSTPVHVADAPSRRASAMVVAPVPQPTSSTFVAPSAAAVSASSASTGRKRSSSTACAATHASPELPFHRAACSSRSCRASSTPRGCPAAQPPRVGFTQAPNHDLERPSPAGPPCRRHRGARARAGGAAGVPGGRRARRDARLRDRGGRQVRAHAWLAGEAAAQGVTVVALDGREVEPTEQGLRTALGDRLGQEGRVLLLVDTYELLTMLDPWMRRTLIPELSTDVRVVLAGREAPSNAWLREYGDLVRVVRLENLPPDGAEAVLRAAGLAGEDARRVNRVVGGHPLGLVLAGAAIRDGSGIPLEEAATGTVVEQVARTYLDALDPDTRRVLEAASVTRRTTLSLLGAELPGEPPGDAFARLRALPFVELGRDGLVVHDAVREATAMRLKALDPRTYRAYRTAAWRCLRGEMRTATRPELWRYTADMLYLIEDRSVRENFFPAVRMDQTSRPPSRATGTRSPRWRPTPRTSAAASRCCAPGGGRARGVRGRTGCGGTRRRLPLCLRAPRGQPAGPRRRPGRLGVARAPAHLADPEGPARRVGALRCPARDDRGLRRRAGRAAARHEAPVRREAARAASHLHRAARRLDGVLRDDAGVRAGPLVRLRCSTTSGPARSTAGSPGWAHASCSTRRRGSTSPTVGCGSTARRSTSPAWRPRSSGTCRVTRVARSGGRISCATSGATSGPAAATSSRSS